ncbi:MAG: agmatine deiminase family protein [Gammaproteobacteria bacterium]|nr:agmatine deiminase family protein [Gammaproteobacteria bacterium]
MAAATHNRLLPPEWAPQDGVLLTWPHAHSDWHPLLYRVEPVFVRLARELSRRARVIVSCWDEDHRRHIARLLGHGGCPTERVRLYIAPSNDVWVRDHGPVTVLEDWRPRLIDFRFNGWGHKYNAALDDHVTRRLHQAGAFGPTPREKVDLVLEGGGIETDGRGTLLATASSLLNPTRNAGLDRAGLEGHLSAELGLSRFLWLEHGWLAGDDTDGHIDLLARFCDTRTIAYTACEDPADMHYEPLQAMAGELAELRDADDGPYELVALPLPSPKTDAEGTRLPATYANFLIVNDAVLVPSYDDPADALALERLGRCFPRHELIALDCRPLIEQYGSLHCATMQLPAGVLGAA